MANTETFTTFTIDILFEDDDVVVINKPPGIVVNRSDTTTSGTLEDWMAQTNRATSSSTDPQSDWHALVPSDFNEEYGSPADTFELRKGIVHRLDKDTSGVMIFAKNPGALVNLLLQFKLRQTAKEYLALVHGKLQPPTATLNYPIGRASQDRLRFAVQAEGREAITTYQVEQLFKGLNYETVVEAVFSGGRAAQTEKIAATPSKLRKEFAKYQGFSLVRCLPKTGRTHQIRVHLAHIHHPLVSDATYVGKRRLKLDELWCPRQFLHAAKLTFTHPRTQAMMSIEAPLAKDLRVVLDHLNTE